MRLWTNVAVLLASAALCGWSAPQRDIELSEEDLKAMEKLRGMSDEEWEAFKKGRSAPKPRSTDAQRQDAAEQLDNLAKWCGLLIAVFLVVGVIKIAHIRRRERGLYAHRRGRTEQNEAQRPPPLHQSEDDQ